MSELEITLLAMIAVAVIVGIILIVRDGDGCNSDSGDAAPTGLDRGKRATPLAHPHASSGWTGRPRNRVPDKN
jgi:hypothetical protein